LAFEKREQSVGEVFNIGGGEVVTVNQVLALLAELVGRSPRITFVPARPGDQRCTAADISKAQLILGYRPDTPILKGLQTQFEWQRNLSVYF
jgi:UDP-glucuronate 4-epimerase